MPNEEMHERDYIRVTMNRFGISGAEIGWTYDAHFLTPKFSIRYNNGEEFGPFSKVDFEEFLMLRHGEDKRPAFEPDLQEASPEAVVIDFLAKSVYRDNKDKGFWDDQANPLKKAEKICLMHSELSEALEAVRKDLMDDKLPHRAGDAVEMADTVIRILDYCGAYDIPLGTIIEEKLVYNRTRPYKHGKNF